MSSVYLDLKHQSEVYEPTAEDFEKVDVYALNRTDQVVGKPSKYPIDIIRRFIQNRWAVFLLAIIVLIIGFAIFAPISAAAKGITAFDPIVPNATQFTINLPARTLLNPNPGVTRFDATLVEIQTLRASRILDENSIVPIVPGAIYQVTYFPYRLAELRNVYPIIGTDGAGVDIWTKLWTAVGISLSSAVLVALSALVIGVVYGSIAGSFAGKAVDTVMMRFVEIIGGVPSLIWLLIISTALAASANPDSSVRTFDNRTINLALIFILWFSPAITTRTYILRNKDVEYVQAARTLGASQARIIFFHLIPVVLGKILVQFVNFIPAVIFYEASLVFLNLKSTSDLGLGLLLNDTIQTNNPSVFYSPIVVFSLLTISSQIVANALNDAIDPRVIGR